MISPFFPSDQIRTIIMDSSKSLIFSLPSLLIFLPFVITTNSNLVFHKCANRTFTTSSASDQSHSQTLSTIFQELAAQSLHSKFFETVAGDENFGISALFQCRGDLGNEQCHDCVSSFPGISNTNSLCKQSVAGRIQLDGCYFLYKTDEFREDQFASEKHELLHETCGESQEAGIGFEEERDAALAAAESGVVGGGDGLCELDYEDFHVMAQCEGGLGACDCGECVSSAVEIAQEKCGSSISGQIYLDKCFLSYTHYPNGIPGNLSPEKRKGGNNVTAKTGAIVLGVVAVIGAGFILVKSKCCRKKDNL